MVHPTFIRSGLLRVSLRSVGAALGPCDLSVPLPSSDLLLASPLRMQPWPHQTLKPSLIYTHPWCSFQAHSDRCSLLFLLCHLSISKCFANSAQFITSCLLNPSSNSLSPACSQCKHSNACLFASALCHIAIRLNSFPGCSPGGVPKEQAGEQDRLLNTGKAGKDPNTCPSSPYPLVPPWSPSPGSHSLLCQLLVMLKFAVLGSLASKSCHLQ